MSNTTQALLDNIDRPTNPDLLRKLYAEVKAGAPMPHVVAYAAINGLADKECARKARAAFEKLGMRAGEMLDLDTLEALAREGRWLALVKVSGARPDIWAAAMTAHYGPTTLHESWCNPDGTPSEKCLAAFPGMSERMAEAKKNVVGLIGWYRRVERRAA